MNKQFLTIFLGLMALLTSGHFIWAQTTGGAQLNAPKAIKSRFTIEQGTHGVMTEFILRKNGPNARVDMEVRNFDATQHPGYLSTEIPHTAGIYVNGRALVETVATESAGTLNLSVPISYLDSLLGLPTLYELKVFNADQDLIFGASLDGAVL